MHGRASSISKKTLQGYTLPVAHTANPLNITDPTLRCLPTNFCVGTWPPTRMGKLI